MASTTNQIKATAFYKATDSVSISFDKTDTVYRHWFDVGGFLFALTTQQTLVDRFGAEVAKLDGAMNPLGVGDSYVADVMAKIRNRPSRFVVSRSRVGLLKDAAGETLEFATESEAHDHITNVSAPDGSDVGLFTVIDSETGIRTWIECDSDEDGYSVAYVSHWMIDEAVASVLEASGKRHATAPSSFEASVARGAEIEDAKTNMPSLTEALARVDKQSLAEDLRTIDDLYGRDNLFYGATPEDVKAEARRQVERDFDWVFAAERESRRERYCLA